jgi:hypothetical protein
MMSSANDCIDASIPLILARMWSLSSKPLRPEKTTRAELYKNRGKNHDQSKLCAHAGNAGILLMSDGLRTV